MNKNYILFSSQLDYKLSEDKNYALYLFIFRIFYIVKSKK